MRSRLILGLALASGCGYQVTTGTPLTGSGGAAGVTTTTTAVVTSTTGTFTTTTTTTSTSTTTTSSGWTCTAPCCPKAGCATVDPECIGLVDNAGLTRFGLRVSELDITEPAALAGGLMASILAEAVTPNQMACFLDGKGSFSWLLQFDTAAKTLKTGGAKPVNDPATGYSFLDEVVAGALVQPVTYANVAPGASGQFAATDAQRLVLPVYVDVSTVVILPISGARFPSGYLSASHDCIGKFNAAGLDPAGACLPETGTPSFITSGTNLGGDVDGVIALDDADTVMIAPAKQSLCYLLTGSDPQFGQQNGSGDMLCKRDAGGKIVFQGNACTTGAGCADALRFAATYAAASVKINN
jgi:hypothetical protein